MRASDAKPVEATVCRAKLVEWNAERGFGFADDGRRRVFIHVREFVERPVDPKVGATVTFILGQDRQGRPCGQQVKLAGWGGRLRAIHFGLLAVLLVIPSLALYRLASAEVARGVAYWSATVSVFTFLVYFEDKRRAQQADWRTPESVLHFLELMGGWPGAFLAQRVFRHKSAKLSFLIVFWFIVALYQIVAVDWLMGWPLLSQLRTSVGI